MGTADVSVVVSSHNRNRVPRREAQPIWVFHRVGGKKPTKKAMALSFPQIRKDRATRQQNGGEGGI